MATFEGTVSLKPINSVPTIVRDNAGNWSNDNAAEFIAAIIEKGCGLSTWSLWVDCNPLTKPNFPKSGVWKTKDLQGFMKVAQEQGSIKLEAVRRRTKAGQTFYAPVLKLSYGPTQAASNKLL